MKTITLLSALVLSVIAVSCSIEGVEGPPGIPGRDGFDGLDGEEAYVFEYTADFRAPDYSALLELPGSFVMQESDVALVYLLTEVLDDGTEIWRPLPMTQFTNDGLLQYSFDHSIFDVSVFLDAEFPLGFLQPIQTDDWIVRVVIVPGLFGANGRYVAPVNYEDYAAVQEYYQLSPTGMASPGYKR